jgi:hypothetical protein
MDVNEARARDARLAELQRGFERELATVCEDDKGVLMRLEQAEYIEAMHRIIAGIQFARRALAGALARTRSPQAKGPPDRRSM